MVKQNQPLVIGWRVRERSHVSQRRR